MTTETTETTTPAAPADTGAIADNGVAVELDIGADGGDDTVADTGPVGEEGEVIAYQPTGDVGLDMALGFIGKLGIGPAHPTVQAAKQGDFSFLKAHLAGLGAKAPGWEQYVALAERAYATAQDTATKSAAATRTVVEEAVGGAEAWNQIQSWAKANAEPEERAQINGMLSAGGMQARAAAILLSQLYAQANDTVKEPASPLKGAQSNAASASTGPMSPEQYKIALKELTARVGAHRVGQSAEYADLQSRRRAFRG